MEKPEAANRSRSRVEPYRMPVAVERTRKTALRAVTYSRPLLILGIIAENVVR